jgi:hypothetical protein
LNATLRARFFNATLAAQLLNATLTARLLNVTLSARLSGATDCFSHANCFSQFHHLTNVTAGLPHYDELSIIYLTQVKSRQYNTAVRAQLLGSPKCSTEEEEDGQAFALM